MATAILDRLSIARGARAWDRIDDQAAESAYGHEFDIPAIPNEDCFIYVKAIDNTQVVRQPAPAESRACWSMIAASLTGAVALVGILAPVIYGNIAGLQLDNLRQERGKLVAERTQLELEEARFTSPQHLQEIAQDQLYKDPSPDQVVYLNNPDRGTVARVKTSTKDQAR